MSCVVHVPPTPWPPAIRHNTLRMEWARGRWNVLDHAWVILPKVWALTPDENIQGFADIGVHDSVPDSQRDVVMEFQFATTFPNCTFLQEQSMFYECALVERGSPKLLYTFPPYGPEAHDHGNPFWPAHAPLDEGTWGLWMESEVHFRFDLNTDIDWRPLKFIQVYAIHVPRLVTVPSPKVPIEMQMISDTAILSGCKRPTGFITFQLYHDGEGIIFTSEVPVLGNGSYSSAPKFQLPYLIGSPKYHWQAKYSGDENNDALASDPEPFELQPIVKLIKVTDRWEPRDLQTQHPVPGIARFRRDTPTHEEWFKPT